MRRRRSLQTYVHNLSSSPQCSHPLLSFCPGRQCARQIWVSGKCEDLGRQGFCARGQHLMPGLVFLLALIQPNHSRANALHVHIVALEHVCNNSYSSCWMAQGCARERQYSLFLFIHTPIYIRLNESNKVCTSGHVCRYGPIRVCVSCRFPTGRCGTRVDKKQNKTHIYSHFF